MERTYAERLRILNTDAGTVVADAVTVAEASAERRNACLGRDSAAPGEALWLNPCTAVQCCFMRFAVDVAFLDRNLRVVKTVRALRPWHIAGALRAHSVLELRAGSLDRSSTHEGDHLLVERCLASDAHLRAARAAC